MLKYVSLTNSFNVQKTFQGLKLDHWRQNVSSKVNHDQILGFNDLEL
jgi:hypothetical protein